MFGKSGNSGLGLSLILRSKFYFFPEKKKIWKFGQKLKFSFLNENLGSAENLDMVSPRKAAQNDREPPKPKIPEDNPGKIHLINDLS